ncbi:MAG: TonB-dependent receptor [Chloracidobacterium sp.]|nr:TonB-dependent receptor [Chloracidobacterium sp.]
MTGVVVDGNGSTVPNAAVTVREESTVISSTTTDAEGRFAIEDLRPGQTLSVTAPGFAEYILVVPTPIPQTINIFLEPTGVAADVTVSITRSETRLSETPASVVVLTREDLESTAAQTVDDSLRQIAGFTLFRRSSSRTTNPTAQGANLRGISGSGASRAAVLFDGLSLNDAFGGWTYWSRVPLIAVEQAEVLRGGASSLYGSGGLSGAVNLAPPRSDGDEPIFNFRASAGTQDTYDGSLYSAVGRGGWGFDLATETFQTGGYIPVVEEQRGLADTRANSRHNNLFFSIERSFGRREKKPPAYAGGSDLLDRVFARGNLFDERRDNGTSLTYNRTYFRQAAGGADLSNKSIGEFRLRTFFESQVYDQTFAAVSVDRNSETLSRLQRVPSQAAGTNLFWTRPIESHTFAASFEVREVRGFSDEVGYFGGQPASISGSGGSERTFAFFVQDSWAASEKLNLSVGFRVDSWKNFDAHTSTRPLATNISSETRFPDRNETALSPRIAAIYQITPNASIYGSYSRSFRAPTLNELYRGFRVGNVITQANENLLAEAADTFEGGLTVAAFDRRLNVRGNVFFTIVEDPVVSVTLTTTPTLITRRRQNVGKTRTRGIELDAELAIRNDLRLSASYLYADARFIDFPADPDLVGNFLPQVPQQQATFQLAYRPASRFSFGIQARASDAQWEDDLNSLKLRPYFTMDAFAAYRVHKTLELFIAAENVFNSRYDIGLTPIRTVASPAFARIGLRLELGKR